MMDYNYTNGTYDTTDNRNSVDIGRFNKEMMKYLINTYIDRGKPETSQLLEFKESKHAKYNILK